MADNNQSTQGNQQGSTNNKPAGLSWSQPQKPVTSPLLGASTSKFSSSASTPKMQPAKTATVANTNGRGRLFALFLSGAIVGAVLTWGYYTLNPQEEIAQNTETENTPTVQNTGTTVAGGTTLPQTGSTGTTPVPTTGATGGIVLATTQTAGLKVDITSAPVTVPTWVVVYEVVNGQRGNALGAGYFTSTTGARSINLLRPTIAGQKYWVGKRVDNGDKDFTSADQAVLNAAGQPLFVEFTAR
ncbi:MAG: hypothetical protein KBD50_02965 [Candidatus Pacebacteria bacterium]|nr:hypothetical protein [Candidatus Paceibacterota bacterium]